MEGLERFLLDNGVVSREDVHKAKCLAEGSGAPFIGALRQVTSLDGGDLTETLAGFYDVTKVGAADFPEQLPEAERLTLTFLRAHTILPLSVTDEKIVLAMADPGDGYACDAVKLATGRDVVVRIADSEEIEAALERATRATEASAREAETAPRASDVDEVQQLKDLALGTPVVRLVNQLFEDAIRTRATDIHIDPFDGHLKVRFRNDGVMRTVSSPPVGMAKAIASRIKILAGLNVAERRLPQDGRMRIRMGGRLLDMRVATMPTIHGESVSIRLLDNVRRALDLDRLGFDGDDQKRLISQIAAPHGMLVVTGPTGSGKTTTLATLLSRLNDDRRNILTIEDPIEYEIDGINQIHAKPSIGLTFATALRSFLRHDPDVIMVGEMRDGETAGIGVHAALTGHLVLTTLHTNTASGAIPRLLDMGVDGYLLASSLRCVVAQRLVRKLCSACKVEHNDMPQLPKKLLKVLKGRANGHFQLWTSTGCDRCYGTGYADRMVICEVLELNGEIADMVHRNASVSELEEAARRNGMTTMLEDGFSKCLAGETTTDEVLRVALGL